MEAADVWLTTEGVARFLEVSPASVRGWRYRGTGPRGVRLGRGVRYRLADIEAWVDQQEQRQASSTSPAGIAGL